MTLSVVIPALNATATLGAQLQALASQSNPPEFQLIVVDNGSTDGTGDLARSFQSDRMSVVVVTEPNRGINWARNAGVRQAATGRVLLCDADDVVDQHWVAAMAEALHPGVWVGGQLNYVDLNTTATRRHWNAPDRSTYVPSDPFVDSTYGCNCGFYVEMWEEIGGFSTEISGSGGDENEFFSRAHRAGYRRVDVRDAIVAYRLRPGFRAMLRQRRRQGSNQVLMRNLPGGAELPRISRATVGRAVGRLVIAAPRYAWSGARRAHWCGALAVQSGRWRALNSDRDR